MPTGFEVKVVNKAIKGVDKQKKVQLSKNRGGFRHFQLEGKGESVKRGGGI